MRWIYFNEDPREAAERVAMVARIDAWWRAFAGKTDDLVALFRRKAEWDLPGWMDEHLHPIDPRIMWEFGPGVEGDGHRLVLTPESVGELRPLVGKVLERVPAIPGWEFYDARLPEDLRSAKATVEARASYEIDGFLVRASIGDGHRVDLSFHSPRVEDEEDEEALGAAFVASEALLGEHRLERWIGAIEVGPLGEGSGDDAPRHLISLDRLRERVDAVIESIRDQLTPAPHHAWAEGAEWTMWNLQPEEAEDYPGQLDLFVGKSCNPAMWIAAHSPGAFHSERFSKCGETFCYLKVDGAEGLEGSEFEDKADIEDALDEALIPECLGCHVGGGMGLRYAYIDLALTDAPAAIAAIRERLRAGKVPRRSWILFFDADLGGEWVGIYDDTPEPTGFGDGA